MNLMRKSVAVALLLSLCLTATQSLNAQSRPRRVEQPVSAPQTQADDDDAPAQNESRRPPTLKGNVNDGQQNTQQTTATAETDDGTVEVGEGDVVRVETALVTIPVSVMDRSGRYIPDLRQEDFRIYEDGVEHKVAYFASVEKPFTVALVLDTSGSTQFRLDEIQDAAIAFVDQLRPEDRVMVVAFAERAQVLSEPTNDRRALRNAIRRTHTGGGTSLYDTVDFVINQRFNRIEGRKAIVLFTDGVDTTSKRASYQSNITDAEELDALIYPVQYDTSAEMSSGGSMGGGGQSKTATVAGILIGILGGGRVYGGMGGGGGRGGGGRGGGRGSNRADYERADRYLGDLAQKTGARRYRAENARLEQSFALVAEELRRQYSIGYYPQNVAQAGQRRQIKVRVNRPDLVVRARDSYTSTAANSTAQSGQQQTSAPEFRRRPFVAAR
jgi:Ca-activated chloride channel family protein